MTGMTEESPGVTSAMRVMSLICITTASIIGLVLMFLVYAGKADVDIIVSVGASVILPFLTAGITGKAIQKNTESDEAVKTLTVEATKEVKTRAIEAKETIAEIEDESS